MRPGDLNPPGEAGRAARPSLLVGDVEVTCPLPTDRTECKRVLDAACLQLWGGTEWAKRAKRRCVMPESWRATIAAGMRDKRAA